MFVATDLSGLQRLVVYDAWANRRLAAVVTDSHLRPLRLLAHVCTSELVWLRRMRGEQATTRASDLWPEVSARELHALVEEAAEALHAFVGTLQPDDLDGREAVYRNSTGTEYRTRYGDVLAHVFLHSHYHRGQAATALREADTAPPWTDYIAYVREVG